MPRRVRKLSVSWCRAASAACWPETYLRIRRVTVAFSPCRSFGPCLEQRNNGLTSISATKQRLRLSFHFLCKQGVTGSIPVTSTNFWPCITVRFVKTYGSRIPVSCRPNAPNEDCSDHLESQCRVGTRCSNTLDRIAVNG